MSRRSIVSRGLAIALMLAPALAFAAPSGMDHPMKNCASCHCANMTSSAKDATATSRPAVTPQQQKVAQRTPDMRSINNTVDGSFGP
jgi:hypothetical protein